MIQTYCARCNGLLEALSDAFGPYIRCVACGRLTDLLAPTPDILALLVKIDGHRPIGLSHNLGGARQTDGKANPNRHYTPRYGGTRRKFETLPKDA